ncbi:hypothetical protein [Burkholderia sp. IMCC1007]|nr:hypothetical protein [Burkholderia sp. IMCC1007]
MNDIECVQYSRLKRSFFIMSCATRINSIASPRAGYGGVIALTIRDARS